MGPPASEMKAIRHLFHTATKARTKVPGGEMCTPSPTPPPSAKQVSNSVRHICRTADTGRTRRMKAHVLPCTPGRPASIPVLTALTAHTGPDRIQTGYGMSDDNRTLPG